MICVHGWFKFDDDGLSSRVIFYYSKIWGVNLSQDWESWQRGRCYVRVEWSYFLFSLPRPPCPLPPALLYLHLKLAWHRAAMCSHSAGWGAPRLQSVFSLLECNMCYWHLTVSVTPVQPCQVLSGNLKSVSGCQVTSCQCLTSPWLLQFPPSHSVYYCVAVSNPVAVIISSYFGSSHFVRSSRGDKYTQMLYFWCCNVNIDLVCVAFADIIYSQDTKRTWCRNETERCLKCDKSRAAAGSSSYCSSSMSRNIPERSQLLDRIINRRLRSC